MCGFLQLTTWLELLLSLGFDACAHGLVHFYLGMFMFSLGVMLEDERSSCLRWLSLCSYCKYVDGAQEHVTDSCGYMYGYDDVYHALILYVMYTSRRMLRYGVVHHCIN